MSAEKITRYHVINKENVLFGWEKKEDSSVFCLYNFFSYLRTSYLYINIAY